MRDTPLFQTTTALYFRPTISYALLPFMKFQRFIGRLPFSVKVSTDVNRRQTKAHYSFEMSKPVIWSYTSGLFFIVCSILGMMQSGVLGWQFLGPDEM